MFVCKKANDCAKLLQKNVYTQGVAFAHSGQALSYKSNYFLRNNFQSQAGCSWLDFFFRWWHPFSLWTFSCLSFILFFVIHSFSFRSLFPPSSSSSVYSLKSYTRKIYIYWSTIDDPLQNQLRMRRHETDGLRWWRRRWLRMFFHGFI